MGTVTLKFLDGNIAKHLLKNEMNKTTTYKWPRYMLNHISKFIGGVGEGGEGGL